MKLPADSIAVPRNQKPEQKSRDKIDAMLVAAGWAVQDMAKLDFGVGRGIAVREYPTATGPADYILFVDRQPLGVIEAKSEAQGQNISLVAEQSAEYAKAKLKWVKEHQPLRFIYESTGVLTRFRDMGDPKPRSRELFSFYCPETLAEWASKSATLRARLHDLPDLPGTGLRDCQFRAIASLEASFRDNRPRALIQMATGSGKTFTAISSIYRLLKFAKAERILFLVDTRNLGEQAEQEFMAYVPVDDNRKFTELYNVQRLSSSHIAATSQVIISTIQRLYSILKGEPLDEAAEQANPAEQAEPKAPLAVGYNPQIPIEFFDFIVIDECHRSIYNLWRQVLDYFDAFLIGLTATPDKRTFAFFHENVVSEYSHEDAVADGVNVGYDVYLIETEITQNGAELKAEQLIEKRNRLTRAKRWEMQDEDESYSAPQLDRDIVNPSQIRTIIRTFRTRLPQIFPGRQEVPKTIIFAKTDSHADDIIEIVREEFGEGNDFCKKVTYQASEDPKSLLAQFRNSYYPRIAVTVDMIATGTDVRPLECLLFMRDVKSRTYFEQMKGRGTRTLDADGLKKVTPSASSAKTHFVIVDAIGVTRSLKTDSRSLERQPGVSLKELLYRVMLGTRDEETLTSLANRLGRLNNQLNEQERRQIGQITGGQPLSAITRRLLNAVNPDVIEARAKQHHQLLPGQAPSDEQWHQAQAALAQEAAVVFTGPVCDLIESIRRSHEQVIDSHNLDQLIKAEWAGESEENARAITQEFRDYLEEHKDEIIALRIFFDQPHRRREVTYQMVSELLEQLRADRPKLAPLRVWQAYAHIDARPGQNPQSELTTLVALIRRVSGLDQTLTNYGETVERNFKNWIFKRHAGAGQKFNEAQMHWLRLIRDHIAASIHLERDDLDFAPFDAQGGLGRMWQLFGREMDNVIDEMNEALVA